MKKLGLTPQEQQQLAMALFQLETSGANPDIAAAYASRQGGVTPSNVAFGSAEALPSATAFDLDPGFKRSRVKGVGTVPIGMEAGKTVRATTLPAGQRTPEEIVTGVVEQTAAYGPDYDPTGEKRKKIARSRIGLANRLAEEERALRERNREMRPYRVDVTSRRF